MIISTRAFRINSAHCTFASIFKLPRWDHRGSYCSEEGKVLLSSTIVKANEMSGQVKPHFHGNKSNIDGAIQK